MFRIALLAFLLSAFSLNAQNELDSLYKKASTNMDMTLAREVKRLALQEGDKAISAKASYLLGYMFEQDKSYSQSIYAYFEAQLLYDELGEYIYKAQLDDNIGKIFFRLYNYEQALIHFNAAVEQWELLENHDYMAQSQYNVGLAYRYLEQYDSSLHYLNRSLDYQQMVEDELFVADIMNEMGIIQWKLNNFDLAKNYYMYLSDLATSLGDTLMLSKAFNNLGNAYKELGDCNMASSYFEQAFVLKESISSPTIISTINNLAEMAYVNGNYQKAIDYYETAIDQSIKSEHLAETYRGLVVNYKAVLQYEKALTYAEKLDALNISVKQDQLDAERDRLYFMGQLALQRMNVVEQQINHRQTESSLWIVLCILSITLILTIVFYYIKTYRKNLLAKTH